jgi:hypothetical protein
MAKVFTSGASNIPPDGRANLRPRPTRSTTRQLSGHFQAEEVHAFHVLAAELDLEVQELLAEAVNLLFEHHKRPNRIVIKSGRRKRNLSLETLNDNSHVVVLYKPVEAIPRHPRSEATREE